MMVDEVEDKTKEYIGDHVSAELDRLTIKLTTKDRNVIFLDDYVLVNLIQYARKHKPNLNLEELS